MLLEFRAGSWCLRCGETAPEDRAVRGGRRRGAGGGRDSAALRLRHLGAARGGPGNLATAHDLTVVRAVAGCGEDEIWQKGLNYIKLF